jgi:ketosteroid isomerase-like protein
MTVNSLSRRLVLKASPLTLLTSVIVPLRASPHDHMWLNSTAERIIRRWYAAWESDDWHPIDLLATDDFTFSSAAGDDHIDKNAFKTQCWESQRRFIHRFDLQRIFGMGDEALVKYVCHTKNGKSFRNVEYFRLRDDRVQALECYFGAQSSFPSAASAKND